MTTLKIPLLVLGGATVVGTLVMLASPSVDRPEAADPGETASASHARPDSAPPAARAGVASSGSALRQHQSALRHDVNTLRQQLDDLQQGEPTSSAEPEPESEPELEPGEVTRAIAQSYEQFLDQEAVDGEWADQRQDHYASFFAAEQVEGSWLHEVSCGSTLCRLEVASNSVDDRHRLIDEVSSLLEPNAQGFAHIEGADDLEIQIYLSREDSALPVFDG